MPSATSRAIEPVGITAIGACPFSPSRITEPLPNCLSICARAKSRDFSRSGTAMGAPPVVVGAGSFRPYGHGQTFPGQARRAVDENSTCGNRTEHLFDGVWRHAGRVSAQL